MVSTTDGGKGWSITWVVALLIALVVSIGWCFVAGGYASETQGWRPAGGELVRGPRSMGGAAIVAALSFALNGLEQLGNFFGVVQYGLQEQFGVVVGCGVLIGLLVAAGFGLKRLEQTLDKPYARRR